MNWIGGSPGTGTELTAKGTKITKGKLGFFFVAFARFVVTAWVHAFNRWRRGQRNSP